MKLVIRAVHETKTLTFFQNNTESYNNLTFNLNPLLYSLVILVISRYFGKFFMWRVSITEQFGSTICVHFTQKNHEGQSGLYRHLETHVRASNVAQVCETC